MTKSSIGIKNVRIIDPYNNIDNVLDILIENGKITNIAEGIFSQSGNSNLVNVFFVFLLLFGLQNFRSSDFFLTRNEKFIRKVF